MKKVLKVLLPILLIVGALVLLYLFVLVDMVDPPPDKVVKDAIEAAQLYVQNSSQTTEDRFISYFTARSQVGLRREWSAVGLDGTPRGSWYELASGLLNSDQSRPQITSIVMGEPDDAGNSSTATVNVQIDRVDHPIPLEREEGLWRIQLPTHPSPWVQPPSE
jgi:hypothetical protein